MNARIDSTSFARADLRFAPLPSGAHMPYVVCGTGEPVVFVHGSLCDYRYWDSQVEFLSKRFSCVSVSLSHHWPVADGHAQGMFSWRTHVAELAEFIAAMDAGPVHLVGHSRGGCVAFHLASQYPSLVQSLTLADPGGPLQLDGVPEAALSPGTIALRAKVADLIDSGAVEAGLELFVDSVSMPTMWRKSPEKFRAMALANAATLPMQFNDPLPAYTRAAAAALQCKTLLIEGEKSPGMYRENVEKLAGWVRHVDKRSIAGASHGMNVTHAGAFNRLIEGFVSGGQ